MFDQVHEDFLAGREYQRAAEDRQRVYLDRAAAHALFADRVMRWHRPVVHEGWPPMCTCGNWGRRCRYLAAAHELLGARLPWCAS